MTNPGVRTVDLSQKRLSKNVADMGYWLVNNSISSLVISILLQVQALNYPKIQNIILISRLIYSFVVVLGFNTMIN